MYNEIHDGNCIVYNASSQAYYDWLHAIFVVKRTPSYLLLLYCDFHYIKINFKIAFAQSEWILCYHTRVAFRTRPPSAYQFMNETICPNVHSLSHTHTRARSTLIGAWVLYLSIKCALSIKILMLPWGQ